MSDEEPTQARLDGSVQTELVNQHKTNSYDIDIGRADNGQSHMNNTEAGEPGWIGNPYPESEHGREKCIELFREDFEERIASDPEFRNAVENLRGKTLGCWCSPKPCHGDVIIEYINSTDGESNE